jgi:hypothetical protein
MNPGGNDWIELNQRYLAGALQELRTALEQQARRNGHEAPAARNKASRAPQEYERASSPAPPALEILSKTFGLSPFERAILLLCAGIELDSSFPPLCAEAQRDPARSYPTFSLALAALPEPHWSALNPGAPLRHWRLMEILHQPGTPLTTVPLRIDERILHFLTGVQHLDERLVGSLEVVRASEDLAPSHSALAHKIANMWRHARHPLPMLQLCGTDDVSRRSIAASGCAQIGLLLHALKADDVPAHPVEFEGFVRLWEREAALTSSALFVETEATDRTDAKAQRNISRLLERLRSPLLLSTRDQWRPLRRVVRTIEVCKPTPEEQRVMWYSLLGKAAAGLNGQIGDLVAQFNLNASAIRASVTEALEAGAQGGELVEALWNAGRSQARPRLEELAQRIEAVATWDDLVLPDHERSLLKEIAVHVRQRATVYESWGFAASSNRGLGISALFAGASGTGKTMAAEVLANSLRLDLYCIDLSSVVSKYIGETEKNLRRVFDAAEDGGAILFFDEADALFGKRSEVKDSHDRYANIEINYLLQRMEQYRGLAVLATNMKSALDPAFLRRIRFVVNFPFPDATQRADIWQRVFPPSTPAEGLDVNKLARLNVAGGNIRNIALNAAFLAADSGQPVQMSHLARAARNEYAKIEKPAPEAEIVGWQ